MNKSSHFWMSVGLGLATASGVFAGPVDLPSKAVIGSSVQRDSIFGGLTKPGYETNLRISGTDVAPAKASKAAIASINSTPLREPDQQPLTGSLTLLAGLALIGGIAVRRLSI